MRKTRLVLIPGVKSLETIGCLLLFLACPTIAFKGQENREVDALCKSQNLKEFWVDSPWPGDTDNIGWVRGFGGGYWPGNSQKQSTCNARTTRSVVQSDHRRVQGRREISGDDGIRTRTLRMENTMRMEMSRQRTSRVRNMRDTRRTGDELGEHRRMDLRRAREIPSETRGLPRSATRDVRLEREFREMDTRGRNDVRVRVDERRIVNNRETIEGSRNSGDSVRNTNRQVKSERVIAGPETHRAVFSRERTDATETRTARNQEVPDIRRHSPLSRATFNERIRNIESRRSSQDRDDSIRRNDHALERRSDIRAVSGRTYRLKTQSAERDIRTHRENREEHIQRRLERSPRETVREAVRQETRDMPSNMISSVRSRTPATERSERDARILESRLARNSEHRRSILQERRSSDMSSSDSRVSTDDSRDSRVHNIHQDDRSARASRRLDSHIRNTISSKRLIKAERQTVNNREPVDGSTLLQNQERFNRIARNVEHRRSSPTRDSASERSRSMGRRNDYDNKRLTEQRRSNLEMRALARDTKTDVRMDSRLSIGTQANKDIRRTLENTNEQSIVSAKRASRNDNIRNTRDREQIHSRRNDAINSRESRRSHEEERRNYRNLSSRNTRSLENIRSTDERSMTDRRRAAEDGDSRRSVVSLDRVVRNKRETTDQQGARDVRQSRVSRADSERARTSRINDERRDSRLSIQSRYDRRALSSRDMVERLNPERISRRVMTTEETVVREERQRRSVRSSEESRRVENRVNRERDAERHLDRREREREVRGGVRSTVQRRNDIRQLNARAERLSRSSSEINTLNKQTVREMQLNRRRIEQQARRENTASFERTLRISDVDHNDNRLVRGNNRVRNFATSQRDARSVVASRQDNRVTDNMLREGSRIVIGSGMSHVARDRGDARRDSDVQTRELRRASRRQYERSIRATGQSESRRQSMITSENENRRMDDSDRTQRQPQDQSWAMRRTTQQEILSARATRASEQESLKTSRRDAYQENRRVATADLRRANRDARDAESRRTTNDVLIFESVRAIPKESRRSERQRRIREDSMRTVEKRQENTESSRRLIELADLTGESRRSETREKAREAGNGWAFSYKERETLFESSKNALASWLPTTTMSWTDNNGIAETLMYGGIACFALFSNVNTKKIIF